MPPTPIRIQLSAFTWQAWLWSSSTTSIVMLLSSVPALCRGYWLYALLLTVCGGLFVALTAAFWKMRPFVAGKGTQAYIHFDEEGCQVQTAKGLQTLAWKNVASVSSRIRGRGSDRFELLNISARLGTRPAGQEDLEVNVKLLEAPWTIDEVLRVATSLKNHYGN